MFNIQDILDKVGLEKCKGNGERTPTITIEIEGDMNDADYATSETRFNLTGDRAEQDIELLAEIISALKDVDLDDIEDYMNNGCGEDDEDDKEKDLDEKTKKLELLYYNLNFPCLEGNTCHSITALSISYTDENGVTTGLSIKE